MLACWLNIRKLAAYANRNDTREQLLLLNVLLAEPPKWTCSWYHDPG